MLQSQKATRRAPVEDMNPSAARAMWQAVLYAALRDANGIVAATNGGENPKKIISQAQSWLGTRDFYEVCAHAGVDSNFILDAYRAGRFRKMKRAMRYVTGEKA